MRRGQREAAAERFEMLYSAHHAQVFGYVLRRCERAEDAADVIAEVFLVLWRRIDQVPAGDETRPWLYGVARRLLANHRRGARRRSALTERLQYELVHSAWSPSHTEVFEADSREAAVAIALAELSDADREILRLEAWEGLAPAEIAVVLDCSAGAARTRLHRARERLRARLGEADARGPHREHSDVAAPHRQHPDVPAPHLSQADTGLDPITRRPDTTGGRI